MKNFAFITIITPTYNRCDTLKRTYDSILNQKYESLKWLIIDDGSTDNTKELIDSFINENRISIKYHYKPNGGKHTALNLAFEMVDTKYCMIIDSDDELYKNALEKAVFIAENENDSIWQICGRTCDENNKMIGKKFPANINTYSRRLRLAISYKIKGEKISLFRTEILKKYRFPIYNDTNFVSEGMLYRKINHDYDSYYTNEIFRVYHTETPKSLTNASKTINKKYDIKIWNTFYHYSLTAINDFFWDSLFDTEIIFCIVNLSRCAIMSKRKYNDVMKEINKNYKKVFVTLGYIISYCFCYFAYNEDRK